MGKDYTKNQLVKKFIELDKDENETKNLFLYAGGGYGKTTAMLCLFKYLLTKASNGENIVPIYIDVKKLNFKESKPIISYIKLKYSGSDTEEKDIENLFTNQCPAFSKKYTYYFLIDGLNETNDSNKGDLKDDIINMIDNSSKVRFVISSRVNEGFDRADFNTFELQKLSEEQIRVYLDKTFGEKYNNQTKVKEINKSLIEILRIPMFMNVFSKTYSEKSPYPDIYNEKTVRKADILDSFIQKILNDMKIRANSCDNNILEFVINFFLPALAFQMADNNVLNIDSKTADDKLCLNYFLSFFSGKQKEKIKSLIKSDKYMPVSICCETFALVSDNDGKYSFIHQIWRDFFAAKHIINCMNAERLDELEISVDENVRQFVGELIREYDNNYKFSKSYTDNDLRRSECDFEEKDNLKNWTESPVEHFMQQHNMNSGNPISPIDTSNLIDIMKTCRNKKITACYDSLDLKYVNISRCDLRNSTFNYAKIYRFNFLAQGHRDLIISVAISPNGKKIVSGGADKTIRIWDARTGIQIGEPLTGHTDSVSSVAISPNGKKIVSGGRDGTIHIWDAETGKHIGGPLIWHSSVVESVVISQDGKKIVSGSDDKTIRIWDLETGEQIGEPLTGHTNYISSIAISQDGKRIVSGSTDKTIRIWDTETGRQIGDPLTGHTGVVSSVAISQDGKRIASGSNDVTLCIWDMEKKTRFTIKPILSIIQDCHFENTYYDQPEPDDFYRILYTNGASVPKKYEPKSIHIKDNNTFN